MPAALANTIGKFDLPRVLDGLDNYATREDLRVRGVGSYQLPMSRLFEPSSPEADKPCQPPRPWDVGKSDFGPLKWGRYAKLAHTTSFSLALACSRRDAPFAHFSPLKVGDV